MFVQNGGVGMGAYCNDTFEFTEEIDKICETVLSMIKRGDVKGAYIIYIDSKAFFSRVGYMAEFMQCDKMLYTRTMLREAGKYGVP